MNTNIGNPERRMIPMQYDSKTDGIRTDIAEILRKIEDYIIIFSPDRVRRGRSLRNKLFLIVNTEYPEHVLTVAKQVVEIVINKLTVHNKSKDEEAIKQIINRLDFLAALLFEAETQPKEIIRELFNLRDFCEKT